MCGGRKGSGAASLLVGEVQNILTLFPASVALPTTAPSSRKFSFPVARSIFTGQAKKAGRVAETERERFYFGTWNSLTLTSVELDRATLVCGACPPPWPSGAQWGESCSSIPIPENPALPDRHVGGKVQSTLTQVPRWRLPYHHLWLYCHLSCPLPLPLLCCGLCTSHCARQGSVCLSVCLWSGSWSCPPADPISWHVQGLPAPGSAPSLALPTPSPTPHPPAQGQSESRRWA